MKSKSGQQVTCSALALVPPSTLKIRAPDPLLGGEEYFPSTVPVAGSSLDPTASLPTDIDATIEWRFDESRAARGKWVQRCNVPSVYKTHCGIVARFHQASFDESVEPLL